MDNANPMGKARDLSKDMARHEDGYALFLGEFEQEFPYLDDPGRIQTVRWLVKDE